ncbi:MAG: WG repeat-containing protein [Prevotellaceae bacterium]|nr:WG repeat-containing protein [Prevotellaceae bacterium]
MDKNEKLLIHKHEKGWAWIAIVPGVFPTEKDSSSFPKLDVSKSPFLIPYMENEKWGFIDSTRKVIIQPKYDFVRLFEKGIARVKLNGKWGLINEKGDILTDFKYDRIYLFNRNVMSISGENDKDSINDDLLL